MGTTRIRFDRNRVPRLALGDDTWWANTGDIAVNIHGGNLGMSDGCGIFCTVSYKSTNVQTDLGFRALVMTVSLQE